MSLKFFLFDIKNQPSRIDKIDEVIETLGSTLSSLKIKKGEATVGKKPKFIYVPKNPRSKPNLPINEEGGSKTTKEVSSLNQNDQSAKKSTILDSPSVINKFVLKSPPKRTSCTIEEIFDDLDDGYIDNT